MLSEAAANPKQQLSFFSNFFGMLSPKKPGKTANLLHMPRDLPALRTTPPRPGSSTVLERVFRNFDEDGDGKISPAELSTCMRTIGEELSAEDAEAVVVFMDSDGDGLLGFDDFLKLVEVEVEEEEEKGRNLREAFGVYKMEGEDCITPKSLRGTLERLGQSRSVEECKAMIRRFDLDGDGVISFDEFRVMML